MYHYLIHNRVYNTIIADSRDDNKESFLTAGLANEKAMEVLKAMNLDPSINSIYIIPAEAMRPKLKKILMTLPSGRYHVGYSTSLKSFLEDNSFSFNKEDLIFLKPHNDNYRIFHLGHQKIVTYQAVEISENETCFVKL